MLHVCSIFVWIVIKLQGFPLILKGKITDKALFYLYEDINFICVTYIFDLGLVFKFQFSFIYIYILFSRRFYPKRLTNEDNRSNQTKQKSNNMQVLH